MKRFLRFFILLLMICPFIVSAKTISLDDLKKSLIDLKNIDFTKYDMLPVNDVSVDENYFTITLDNSSKKLGLRTSALDYYKLYFPEKAKFYDEEVDDFVELPSEEAFNRLMASGDFDSFLEEYEEYKRLWENNTYTNNPSFRFYIDKDNNHIHFLLPVYLLTGRIIDLAEQKVHLTYAFPESNDYYDAYLSPFGEITNLDYYIYYAIASYYGVPLDDVINYRKQFDDYGLNLQNKFSKYSYRDSYALIRNSDIFELSNRDEYYKSFLSRIIDIRDYKVTDNKTFWTRYFDPSNGKYLLVINDYSNEAFSFIDYEIDLNSDYSFLVKKVDSITVNPETKYNIPIVFGLVAAFFTGSVVYVFKSGTSSKQVRV